MNIFQTGMNIFQTGINTFKTSSLHLMTILLLLRILPSPFFTTMINTNIISYNWFQQVCGFAYLPLKYNILRIFSCQGSSLQTHFPQTSLTSQMKAEILRNPKMSLHGSIPGLKWSYKPLNLNGRFFRQLVGLDKLKVVISKAEGDDCQTKIRISRAPVGAKKEGIYPKKRYPSNSRFLEKIDLKGLTSLVIIYYMICLLTFLGGRLQTVQSF